MMKILGSAESFGKIILTGEHAVVYNRPAIAFPFKGLKTKVTIYETNDEITIESKHFNGYLDMSENHILGLKKIMLTLLDKFEKPRFGLHIKIESNNISGRGLGSSAAVSVALTKALYSAFKIKENDEEIYNYAMLAEEIHHTNPSGLDVATLVYNKPIWFVKGKAFSTVELNFKATILIIDIGMESQTKLAVEHVRSLYKRDENKINSIFDNIKEISFNARKALLNNDFISLEEALFNNQDNLVKLEVSNDRINEIIDFLRQKGIKGAKITGGGMGGCLIALVKDQKNALDVKKTLVDKGINNVWYYTIGE